MNINKFLLVTVLFASAGIYAAQPSHLQAVIVHKDYSLMGRENNAKISKFFSNIPGGSILKGSLYGLGALGALMSLRYHGPKAFHDLNHFGVRKFFGGVNAAPTLQAAGFLTFFVTALARLKS